MTVAACSCQIRQGGTSEGSANQGVWNVHNAILTSDLHHTIDRPRQSSAVQSNLYSEAIVARGGA
jgi:hypothetical protein